MRSSLKVTSLQSFVIAEFLLPRNHSIRNTLADHLCWLQLPVHIGSRIKKLKSRRKTRLRRTKAKIFWNIRTRSSELTCCRSCSNCCRFGIVFQNRFGSILNASFTHDEGLKVGESHLAREKVSMLEHYNVYLDFGMRSNIEIASGSENV